LPAAASTNNPAILIAAISGRSLAAAARRAGYRPLVADLFCDSDTVALADGTARLSGSVRGGIDGEKIIGILSELLRGEKPAALVYGSGFERQPDIIDALGSVFPMAGNSAATVRAVKDPAALSRLCASLDVPHPPIRFSAPERPQGWLIKLGGGAGGSQHFGPVPGAGRRRTHHRLQPAMVLALAGIAVSLWRRGEAHALRPEQEGADRPLARQPGTPHRPRRPLQR
jgi:predicted ATP-grasp superfamily ATP-dependent carboligase